MECFGFGVSSWLASHLQWQKRARDYFIVAFFECTSSFTAACAPWARTERSSREMRLFFRTQTISSLLHSSRTFFFLFHLLSFGASLVYDECYQVQVCSEPRLFNFGPECEDACLLHKFSTEISPKETFFLFASRFADKKNAQSSSHYLSNLDKWLFAFLLIGFFTNGIFFIPLSITRTIFNLKCRRTFSNVFKQTKNHKIHNDFVQKCLRQF